MAIVELRAWRGTTVDVPYFKLPWTWDELVNDATPDPGNYVFWLYRPDFPFPITRLEPPFLAAIRWMCERANAGINAFNFIISADAGTNQWIVSGGDPTGGFAHAPGAIEPLARGSWTQYQAVGGTRPTWSNPLSSPRTCMALPSEFGTLNFSSADLGSLPHFVFVTSDGVMAKKRFSVQSYQNGLATVYVAHFIEGDKFTTAEREQFPVDLDDVVDIPIEEFDTENDPSGGGGSSNILSRYTPRIATNTVGAYVMDAAGVQRLLFELWDSDLIDQIRSVFIGDGSNALLGLRYFYGIKYAIQTNAGGAYVRMGNVTFEDAGYYSTAAREFVEYSAGRITVPKPFNDFRDWSAIAYSVYIPFVGNVDLKPDQVAGKSLVLKYNINITDGSAVAILSNSEDYSDIIFSTSCSWGYDIPIRVEAAPDLASRLIRLTGVPGVIESLGGGPGGNERYQSGELSPNSSVMGDFTPKLIMFVHSDESGANFNTLAGVPGGGVRPISDFSGYLKVAEVNEPSTSTHIPPAHFNLIVEALKDGVYV